eukprot:5881642-Pyramimonas_sp.AAC.2
MLERSVEQCYFVTLVTATVTTERGQHNIKREVTKEMLEEDASFFDTRLTYLALQRNQVPGSEAGANFW